MANTNFVTLIAPAKLIGFKSTVVELALEHDVVLEDRIALGNGQSWSLVGVASPKPSVIAYCNGKVVWQNLNPQRIGLECKFLSKWGNIAPTMR